MSKKIIITGATGQLGSYLIELILNTTDYQVVAAIRRTSQIIDSNLKNVLNSSKLKVVFFDLNDACSITNLVKEEKPDFLINAGASTFVADSWKSPVNCFQVNAMGVLHLLEAIKNFAPKCRFLNMGSSEELSDPIYAPQDINHPLNPKSPYGCSKASARYITKVYRESYGIYAIHVTAFNYESPRRQAYFVSRKITLGVARILKAIQNKKAFRPIELGNVNSKRDWSDARDFANGILKAIHADKPDEYLFASGETHSVKEFVELAFKCAGIDGFWHGSGINEEFSIANYLAEENDVHSSVLVKINPEFYRPWDVNLLHGCSKITQEKLNWKPERSFQDLVREMVSSDIANYKSESP